jgi:hypothetical protein
VGQSKHNLKQFSRQENSTCLELNFWNCLLEHSDIEELTHRVAKVSAEVSSLEIEMNIEESPHQVAIVSTEVSSLEIDMSFSGCQFNSQEAAKGLVEFVFCQNIKWLIFSLSQFHVREILPLVAAASRSL